MDPRATNWQSAATVDDGSCSTFQNFIVGGTARNGFLPRCFATTCASTFTSICGSPQPCAALDGQTITCATNSGIDQLTGLQSANQLDCANAALYTGDTATIPLNNPYTFYEGFGAGPNAYTRAYFQSVISTFCARVTVRNRT